MHRRLISLASDARLALATTVGAALIAGWLIILQAYLLSTSIDLVFLGRQSLEGVSGLLGLAVLVTIGRAILVGINESASNRIAQSVKTDLRNRLMQHLFALGPAFGHGERTGDITATAVEGIEALDAYYGQYLPQLLIGILVPVSILLVVLPRDLLSGVILCLTAPLIPFFMYMIGRGAEVSARERLGALGRLSSYFLDSLQGLATLKAFGQSRAQAENIARVGEEFRRLTLRVMQRSFLSAFALELLATMSTAIIAVEVGLRLLYSRMQFADALFLLILAPEFYQPLRTLGLRFHAALSGTAAARRIFAILDTPLPTPEPATQDGPRDSEASVGSRWNIELAGVSYTYPGQEKPALDELDLHIAPGTHVALVGASGSGKSTLASLLLGFIEPSAGHISVRSESGRTRVGQERRWLMAWVPQRPHLFRESVAMNIRAGNVHASQDDIVQAARSASLDQTIESLPEQYETSIAEGGSRLSGGEAQRLALARAFLRNAPILILDEPTSNLDPENEALLKASTRRLMHGRTVITIAHRLATIRDADLIVVLKCGRIVESGTHAQLLSLRGEYARLVAAPSEMWGLPAAAPEAARTSSRAVADLSLASMPDPPVPHGTAAREPSGQSGSSSGKPEALRLLGFLQGSWLQVALSVLLGALTVGSSVALMGLSAWLISAAALHPSIAALGLAIVGVRFFGIARAVFRYLERLVTHSVTLRLLGQLRVWFYRRLEPLAPARLMQYGAGDLLSRAVDDINTLEHLYVRLVAPPLVGLIVVLGTSAYLALQGIGLALPFAATALLIGLALPALVQRVSRSASDELIRSRADLNALLVDSIQGVSDVLAFDLVTDRLRRMGRASSENSAAQSRLARISAVQSALSLCLTNISMWGVLIAAIPLVSERKSDGVILASLALVTISAFEAVTPLPLAARWWTAVRSAARRVFGLADMKPAIDESGAVGASASEQGAGSKRSRPGGQSVPLSVLNVSFTYPGQRTPALDRVSFAIPAHGSLGLVGPSGAGKSTLVNLLMRFWDYDSGDILLAGAPVTASSVDDVRSCIAWLQQNPHFFDTSIFENLRMASRGVSRQMVEQAARDAQIHEFIASLPAGYDTLVGEHGVRLSAGERQRLAIARAILKDAPILVVDEPTAYLDAATERQVLNILFQQLGRRTVLFVSHRLVGLENLDTVAVLSRGRIVESGSHADLLKQRGLYRRLWDLQNADFDRT